MHQLVGILINRDACFALPLRGYYVSSDMPYNHKPLYRLVSNSQQLTRLMRNGSNKWSDIRAQTNIVLNEQGLQNVSYLQYFTLSR